MDSKEKDNVSISSLREELEQLDSHIANAKNLQKMLEEEKKPLYTMYEWEAPERIYEVKDRKWYVIVSVISMVVIVYALLTNTFLLVAAVVATILLIYALYSIPPGKTSYQITNKGIYLFERLYTWNYVDYFWITQRGQHTLVNIEVRDSKGSLPEKVIILQGDGDMLKITGYLSQFVDYLPQAEVSGNFISNSLTGTYLPLTEFMSPKKTNPTKAKSPKSGSEKKSKNTK